MGRNPKVQATPEYYKELDELLNRMKQNHPVYNEELKISFFKSRSYALKTVENSWYRFSNIHRFESKKEYNKDISLFDEKEMVCTLRAFSKSSRSLESFSSVLNRYLRFVYKGVPPYSVNTLMRRIKDEVKVLETVNGYIDSYKQFHQWVHFIPNKRDAAIIVLLYEGFSNHEIIKLKISDCNLEKGQILHKRNIYPLTLSIIRGHIEESDINDDYNRGYVIKVNKTSGEAREQTSFQIIHTAVSNNRKLINKMRLTESRIMESSMLHEIFLLTKGESWDNSICESVLLKFRENINSSRVWRIKEIYEAFIQYNRISEDYRKEFLWEESPQLDEMLKEPEDLLQFDKLDANSSIFNLDVIYDDENYDNNGTNWVDDNNKLGEKGETFLTNKLKKDFPDAIVNKVKDRCGYDIKFNISDAIYRIEVKSITDITNPINITFNELRRAYASLNDESYYIFLLLYNKSTEEEPLIYVIYNPINFWGIDLKNLKNYFYNLDLKSGTIICSQLQIYLSAECGRKFVTYEHFKNTLIYKINYGDC